MWSVSRWSVLGCLVVAVGSSTAGTVGLVQAQSQVATRTVTVDSVPMLEVSPRSPTVRAPGVVVAHGFAANARLMRGFADTLATRGYVVVLPDLTGHGANTARLTIVDSGVYDELQGDLDAAVRHLRSLPTVDPARIALVGHSMGAGAVTRYAAGHPDIAATVAISLRTAADLPREAGRPRNLLLLVGAAEFPGFRDAALEALHAAAPTAPFGVTVGDPAAGTARRAVSVAATEHISVLYSTQTHAETAAWLDGSLSGPADGPLRPRDRLVPAGLLLLGFVVGFVPLVGWLLPRRAVDAPRPEPVPGRYAYPGLAVGLVLGVVAAGVVPTNQLPLAVGGYAAGFFALVGLGLVGAWALDRATTSGKLWPRRAPETTTSGKLWRSIGAAAVLIGYGVAAIAVPMHLGLTHAVPVGPRWWLAPIVVACVALLLIGAELVSAGQWWRQPLVLAATAVAVIGATLAGLAPGFVRIVLPLLVVLFVWQAAWSEVLRTRSTPVWLAGVVGAIVIAWPIATSMPLVT